MDTTEKPFAFRDYFYWSLGWPGLVFFCASLIMDPMPGITVLCVCLGYWLGILIAVNRRAKNPTPSDALYVRAGFLLLLFLGPLCSIPVLMLRVHFIGH